VGVGVVVDALQAATAPHTQRLPSTTAALKLKLTPLPSWLTLTADPRIMRQPHKTALSMGDGRTRRQDCLGLGS
jgi:hypothetical protein